MKNEKLTLFEALILLHVETGLLRLKQKTQKEWAVKKAKEDKENIFSTYAALLSSIKEDVALCEKRVDELLIQVTGLLNERIENSMNIESLSLEDKEQLLQLLKKL